MRILAWDTELTPLTTYSWSLWPNSIPIQQIVEPQHVMCFGARWVDEPKSKLTFRSEFHHGRVEMLYTIHELLDQADAVISWNGQGFDSRHIRREFLEAGMTPPSPWREIDLMKTAKSQFKFPSNKLDYVAQALGVGQKTPHTGFELWKQCMAGDDKAWKLMEKYQRQDVNLLVDLYDRLLPWIPNHPNVALYNAEESGCPKCGGKNLQRRGYALTGTRKYQRFQCTDCGAWTRGSRSVATTEMR